MSHFSHKHTSNLSPGGGEYESTARNCLALVDRACTRLEEEQAAATRDRAAMREAIKLSGPRQRITQLSKTSCYGRGIIRGKNRKESQVSPEAMELIREYARTAVERGQKHDCGQQDCADRAGVSRATVKKYAKIVRAQWAAMGAVA